MARCPNCGSEAIREEAIFRRSGGSSFLFLGAIVGAIFFALVFAVFFIAGYIDRFIFPLIEYSPFILVVFVAAALTWMIAARVGRSWLRAAPDDDTLGAQATHQHCVVCEYKWTKDIVKPKPAPQVAADGKDEPTFKITPAAPAKQPDGAV